MTSENGREYRKMIISKNQQHGRLVVRKGLYKIKFSSMAALY